MWNGSIKQMSHVLTSLWLILSVTCCANKILLIPLLCSPHHIIFAGIVSRFLEHAAVVFFHHRLVYVHHDLYKVSIRVQLTRSSHLLWGGYKRAAWFAHTRNTVSCGKQSRRRFFHPSECKLHFWCAGKQIQCSDMNGAVQPLGRV